MAFLALIFESKKQVGCLKNRKKRRSEKCYVLIKKRHLKGEKHIAPMDVDVSENSKVYYV